MKKDAGRAGTGSRREWTWWAHRLAPLTVVIPRACGVSSTPKLLGFIINVSGILGRPVKPGDDSGVCFIHQGWLRTRPQLAMTDREFRFKFQTADTRAHSRGGRRPRFACRPPSKEGAGNAGCALHPRSRVQNGGRKRTRAYRFSGGHPTFPAQWFDGL